MKNLIEKNKKLIAFIFSALIVSFMKINVALDGTFIQKLCGNSLDTVIYTILLTIAMLKVWEVKDRRLDVISLIVAIILAICQFLGIVITNGYSFFSKVLLVKVIGYVGIFYVIIKLVYSYISSNVKAEKWNFKKISNKTFFIATWVIIFICYIPYFLRYFPGIATTDSVYQMYQAIGNMKLVNSHPIFHTFIISIALHIGKAISSYNLGVAIYSVWQMLFMSGVFAFCLYYMKKKDVPKSIIILSLVYYAIHPMFSMYSVTMWKDIPFSISITLYTISMIELATNADRFLSSKLKVTFFIISALFTMFFKHNGFYIVLLSIPFVLFYVRKHLKKLAIIYVILVIFYKVINGPVLSMLNVSPTLSSEALSIPIQQLSRVVALADISDDEYNEIREWIVANKENIKNEYNPRLSDPMKRYFNNERYKTDKASFYKLWFKYLKKYPMVYVQSFLCNTYGYWYPETQYWMFQRNIEDKELGLYSDSKLNIKLPDNVIEERNVPIISMISSLGFAFWITGIMAFYSIYKKEYKKLIIYIPVMVLWLTSIASSVFCEFRYMFGFFTTMPLIISAFMIKNNDDNVIEKE